MTIELTRVPQGVREGGQFAALQHRESAVTLGAPAAPAVPGIDPATREYFAGPQNLAFAAAAALRTGERIFIVSHEDPADERESDFEQAYAMGRDGKLYDIDGSHDYDAVTAQVARRKLDCYTVQPARIAAELDYYAGRGLEPQDVEAAGSPAEQVLLNAR